MSSVRRHYRVGQKEVEASHDCVLTCEKKKKYMLFGAVLLLICFIKGLVIGLLLSKDR